LPLTQAAACRNDYAAIRQAADHELQTTGGSRQLASRNTVRFVVWPVARNSRDRVLRTLLLGLRRGVTFGHESGRKVHARKIGSG